ncbi:MAG: hypothetical protein J6S23_04305 [Clostridia bacterium]|nr:hypothetical protein [Clostridia bacterium]
MNCIFLRRGYGASGDGVNYVEYIESSGTQYIDTGIGSIHTITMDIEFTTITGNEALMGQSANAGYYFGINASGYLEDGKSSAFSFLGTERRTVSIVGTSSNQTVSVANESKTTTRSANPSATFKLLGGVSGYPCHAKLYSCQFNDGNTLIRDYRPCLDPDGVACLYDKVNKEYVYNAGTGTFTAGASISGGGSGGGTTNKHSLTFSGDFDATNAYLTVNGTKYTSAGTLSLEQGTSINVTATIIHLNGSRITSGNPVTYTIGITSATTVSFVYNTTYGTYNAYITTE